MGSVYSGEGFNQWIGRVLSAKGYENLPDEASPELLKRRLVKSEYELRILKTFRVALSWFTVLVGAGLLLLIYLHVNRNYLSSRWIFYSVLAILVLLFCLVSFVALRAAWRVIGQKGYIIELREFYKSRLADDIDARRESHDRDLLKIHRQYREDSVMVMEEYRSSARKYKRWHDWFQTIAIVGSVTTSAIATASVYFSEFQVVTIVISLIVGITTGINGYYKFRERSFNLQQASDLIEREYHSVILRVGRYSSCKTEAEAYHLFAQQVESIRDEQNKRQQQLEQPVETKKEE